MRKRFDDSRKIKIKNKWSIKKKVIVISSITVGVLALAAGGFFGWGAFFADSPIVPDEPEIVRFYSPLTGVETTQENTLRPITAVMIENSPEARPQSGLQQAGVVFEAVAEGGITRFIALYQEAQPGLIGPVRSVRPYYIEWAAAFDPAVAHVGGSDEALAMIRSGSYGIDLDQFFNDQAYWRTNDRYAPHNMYTDTKNLDALMAARGKTSSTFTPWERREGERVTQPEPTTDDGEPVVDTNVYVNSITMPVSTGLFLVKYEYNAAVNNYTRYQGGAAHTDRELGQIAPDTVIAMMVDMYLGSDGLHNEVRTTGSGTAYIFQNGIMYQTVWAKTSPNSQITFTGVDGNEIKLNRGQTWITAVPNGQTVTWQ